MRWIPYGVSILIFALACGVQSDSAVKATTSAPTVAAIPRAPSATAGKNSCPHTGSWALCNVEQRLRQAGFVAKRVSGESPKRSGFNVTPVVYSLGHARLEVFIYTDGAALMRDIAKLDTLRVAPIGAIASWDGTPQLIRSGNLAVVYLGNSPQQAERLSLAITAGAPQPGSSR